MQFNNTHFLRFTQMMAPLNDFQFSAIFRKIRNFCKNR